MKNQFKKIFRIKYFIVHHLRHDLIIIFINSPRLQVSLTTVLSSMHTKFP